MAIIELGCRQESAAKARSRSVTRPDCKGALSLSLIHLNRIHQRSPIAGIESQVHVLMRNEGQASYVSDVLPMVHGATRVSVSSTPSRAKASANLRIQHGCSPRIPHMRRCLS